MRGLKVTFTTRGYVVPGAWPIHLDALLAFCATEEALASGNARGPIRSLGEQLPLERETREDQWVWQASALVPHYLGKLQARLLVRRHEPEEIARDARDTIELTAVRRRMLHGESGKTLRLIDAAGKADLSVKLPLDQALLKARLEHYAVRQCAGYEAWCVGDAPQIERLLEKLMGRGIGKWAKNGYGNVVRIEVEPCEQAHEQWKRRVLPWPEPGYARVYAAVRPPYWAPENQVMAWLPAARDASAAVREAAA